VTPNSAVEFPIEPALARAAEALPLGPEWGYEQKYDGFRAIAFVTADGGVILQSRGSKDLRRYFPELTFPPGDYVLDGEIIIDAPGGGEAFGLLQQRIHPAASRIERLSVELAASYVAFDALSVDGVALLDRPFSDRRAALEQLAGVRRAELVYDPADAERWLEHAEGVIAKRLERGLHAGQAHRDGQGEATTHDRLRRHGLPAWQGAGQRRIADPRPV
jgi:ATP-dependent DNA ligase